MLASNKSSKDELEPVECIQTSDKKVELKSLLTPIRATYLFFTSHLYRSALDEPILPSGQRYSAGSLQRHLARLGPRLLLFRCILSIWVVAAAPPPTRCARSARSALRCGCLIPKGTATAPAPRPPAGGRVGGNDVWRGVTRRWRWDDVIGDGMESLALVLASCRGFLVPVRLKRFARSWS